MNREKAVQRKSIKHAGTLIPLVCATISFCYGAHAQEPADTWDAGRLAVLQQQINEQSQKLEDMRQSIGVQEENLFRLQRALDEEVLANARARGIQPPPPHPMLQAAPAYAQAQGRPAESRQPVGQAPETDSRPPEVAQIFDQPGVLTPPGKFVLEPSLQYGYSSNDRVALVGYTIIPALLIGLIDVRQVKTTSATATLTGRYGLNNRFELEAKIPYVYVNGDTVSREIFTGTAVDNVFNSHGSGLGDVEITGRYQLNRGGPDKPFYVAWLRYKSRTGTDLFEVVTDCITRCVGNTTGTGLPLDLPTGSGFDAIQPGITWLFPSDPVVFFGSLSYLHNFPRNNVSRTLIDGQREFLGDVEAGDIIGFNMGMGLALNEKAAISIGYDQNLVAKTKQNGEAVAGSVNVTLATLLLGATYRFNEKASLNVALGAGLTRDTPDVSVTVRVPVTF
ncbi:acetate kinase [Pseudoxanthomonas gei]|uniref:acetate kinase n=1 Tax=Pseudoxanthomonas gei TaxID=1383030 RepID=UPI001B8864BF|nr:acetate kinase [Pseudoxanthomonas gei]